MFDRLVIWGGKSGDLSSHRWVHRAFHQTASKLGISTVWVDDVPESRLERGDTVIAADIWNKFLYFEPGVDYVLHNFSQDHPVLQKVDERNLLRLQVWTYDSFGEEWDLCRQFSREGGVLFQPWGTDLLAEEFLDPVFNPMSREAVFVGAIWGDIETGVELGNESAIEDLKAVLREHGLTFKHFTHIPDQENIHAVRSARLAPAIAGAWQVNHGYLPCRVFKNVSYGAAMFTNVPIVNAVFHDASIKGSGIGELVDKMLRLERNDYENLVRAQQKIAARYSYRESLDAIGRALQEKK